MGRCFGKTPKDKLGSQKWNNSFTFIQANINFEYLFRKNTNDFDLTRAVLKFNKNKVVKYPNCLGTIETDIREIGM